MDAILGLLYDNIFTLASIFVVMTLFYNYYNAKFTIWSRQGVPGPWPKPIFGNVLDNIITRKNILITIPASIATYGKVIGSYLGHQPVLTVADPRLIKKIMIQDFSHFIERGGFQTEHDVTELFLSSAKSNIWHRLRSAMSPTFTSGKMKHMFIFMDHCVTNLTNVLNQVSKSKDNNLDVKHVFGCYTLDVIAKCCFATDLNCAAGGAASNTFLEHAKVFFTFTIWKMIIIPLTPKFILRYFKVEVSPEKSITFFSNVTKELLKQRRTFKNNVQKSVAKDFLQLMIEAGDKNQDGENNKDEDNNQTGSKMSDKEIIANSMLFFAAGYETTGSLLTFASYVLATNQDIQETLFNEVKNIESNFNYDSVTKLEYLDAFINETLRLYAPSIVNVRLCTADYYLNEDPDSNQESKSGIFIPKGTFIVIPTTTLHMSSEYWDQPEQFRPDRFLSSNKDKITPFTYLPFGAGPRNCIGMRFALLEAKIALVRIVLGYKFVKTSKTEDKLDFSPSVIILVAKSVTVGIEKRQNYQESHL